jgi:hypothetical protein
MNVASYDKRVSSGIKRSKRLKRKKEKRGAT